MQELYWITSVDSTLCSESYKKNELYYRSKFGRKMPRNNNNMVLHFISPKHLPTIIF